MRHLRRWAFPAARLRVLGVLCFGIAACVVVPCLNPNPDPMFAVTGIIRTQRDSTPFGGMTVLLFGGKDLRHGRQLVGTMTSEDGRFTLLLGGGHEIACQSLMLRLATIGWQPWQSRPGSLLCTSTCQWLDIRLRLVQGRIDGIHPFDVTPKPCSRGRGFPEPRVP